MSNQPIERNAAVEFVWSPDLMITRLGGDEELAGGGGDAVGRDGWRGRAVAWPGRTAGMSTVLNRWHVRLRSHRIGRRNRAARPAAATT